MSMAVDPSQLVGQVLTDLASKAAGLPSTRVQRPLEPEVLDAGNLLLIDRNDLDGDRLVGNADRREKYLREIARENAQLLLASVFALPTRRVEEAIVAELPAPTTSLPREKPLPKEKPLTKWQEYANKKGIEKRKKDRRNVVWDDVVKDWVPKYGYKKAKAEQEKNWMIPYKDSGGAKDVEPFAAAIESKREKVAKNELQRLRNIARAKKIKVPAVGIAPPSDSKASGVPSSSAELRAAAELALASTASAGKFQDKLHKKLEKNAKAGAGKKRHFDPLVSAAGSETERNMKVLEQIAAKKPKLKVGAAVNKQIHEEETQRANEKRSGSGGKKGGGKKRGTFMAKKGKGRSASAAAAVGKGGGKKSKGGGGGGGGKAKGASKGKRR